MLISKNFNYVNDLFSTMNHVENQKENLWISWTTDLREDFEPKLRLVIQEVESLKNHYPELNCSVEYHLGKMDGYSELFEQLFRTEEQKRAITKSLTQQSPKARQILQCLYQNSGMRHGELAAAVGSSCSGLTNIMKKILLSGAVESVRSGKNTYYHLTDVGQQYCQHLASVEDKYLSKLVPIIQKSMEESLIKFLSSVGKNTLKTHSQEEKSNNDLQQLGVSDRFVPYLNGERLELVVIDRIMNTENTKYVSLTNCEKNNLTGHSFSAICNQTYEQKAR